LASTWLKLESTRHRVAIAGTVTDAQTRAAIVRARVEITAGPAAFTERLALLAVQHGERWATMEERVDRTRTAADGHYHFMDLPAGDYTLDISLPGAGTRYGVAQAQAAVAHDDEGNITMAMADVALPSTALKGEVRDRNGNPALMAEVRLQGSADRAYSDGKGRYLLAAVEAGQQTAVISASGHKTAKKTVQLSRGDVTQLDVALK
jgi:hypothetical protein